MATESTGQAAGEAAAHSGGMPQLDFSSWPSQIFWTALALFILYKVLNGSILPKISGALEDRHNCLLYTSPSPRDRQKSRMPSSA